MKQSFMLGGKASRERQVERIASVLRALSPDKLWRIEIESHTERRSDNQNRYLWGIVYRSILESGQLHGWDTDDLHEYLLGEWAGWEIVEGFGKKRMRPIRRSSKLNKEEFASYIDFIQRTMAMHGIYVPDAAKELAA